MNTLFIIIGRTASGKDTTQKYLADKFGLIPLVLHTTRPKRPNEVNGVDYHFTTNEKFNIHVDNDQFIYYSTFNAYAEDGGKLQEWKYGLRKRYLKGNSVVVTDIDNVNNIKRYYETLGDRVIVVLLEVEYKERLARAISRQGNKFSIDEWRRRSDDENMCYTMGKIENLVDYVTTDDYQYNKITEIVRSALYD